MDPDAEIPRPDDLSVGERGEDTMDPDAEIPQCQVVDLITGPSCVDGRRLRRSMPQASSVSQVLDDNNLLIEILLRLPPKPSSLPRASAVCKRWGSILSDPAFLKLFRKHHRKPLLLGFFKGYVDRFAPIMDSPDRITAACFSLPKSRTSYNGHGEYMGCRHGLAIAIVKHERKTVVWDPLTGQQHSVAFPPWVDDAIMGCFSTWHVTVLCADTEDGHVHGDCLSSPFKLVLVYGGGTKAFCSVYDSVSGVWGDISSTAIRNEISVIRPSILVRNALCWFISGGDILVFDFEIQSLDVIQPPTDYLVEDRSFQILRMEDGGVGLAVLSGLIVQLWERKFNCDGVAVWVLLQKTIPLKGMLPMGINYVLFAGYDEDTNVMVLTTMIGSFTIQLDSMQIKYIAERNMYYNTFYPYTNFYTAVRGVGRKAVDLEPVITQDLLMCST